MADARIYTLSDKKSFEAELNRILTVEKPQNVKDIAEARAHGDLSENAEYDAAKKEEERLMMRTAELQDLLDNGTFIDDTNLSTDSVKVGHCVKVFDMSFDEELEYTIVGATECDPFALRIANDSPIGAALMGKGIGEIAEARTPDGVVKMKILAIRAKD